MSFYVNDIVFAFRIDREQKAKKLINKLKNVFEFRDIRHLQYFLRMRVIQDRQTKIVYLMQDVYMKKLTKNYKIILTNQKISTSFLYQSLILYEKDIDQSRIHLYRQKVNSICYSVIIIRLDIAC